MSSYTKTYITYDIETIGLPFDSFDDTRRAYLIRGADTKELQAKKLMKWHYRH